MPEPTLIHVQAHTRTLRRDASICKHTHAYASLLILHFIYSKVLPVPQSYFD